MEILETERLTLRLLEEKDQGMILTLLNEPGFIKNIGDKQVRDLQGALDYINHGPRAMQQSLGYSLYCCELKNTGEAIGLSGLIKRDGIEHPEVGFAFLEKYCRMGFGFESSSKVIQYAQDFLQLNVLQALCNTENIGSNSLLIKLGFTLQKEMTLDDNPQLIHLYEQSLG
ncbi:GNAT family N-acetyltransferase [Colwelliaceae bacterium 6441]